MNEEHCLSIHASTLEEAIICLDSLVRLQDTRFEEMEIWYKDHEEDLLCPFGADALEKMLPNSAGPTNQFQLYDFHARPLSYASIKRNKN
jgi:hypothetical protein